MSDSLARFEPRRRVTVLSEYPYSLESADFNEDGLEDMLTVGLQGSLWLLLQNPQHPLNFSERNIPAILPHTYGRLGVGDLDGDGDSDFVSAGVSYGTPTITRLFWYENDGAAIPSFEHHLIDAEGANESIVIDLDNDGDLDIAGSEIFYENDGASPPNFSRRSAKDDDVSFEGGHADSAADFDRDGDKDLLAFHGDEKPIV